MPTITILPDNRILPAEEGENLRTVLAREGLIDAPCGGRGTCGKCRVRLDDREVLACQTGVLRDMTLFLPQSAVREAEKMPGARAAFDIGTTTVVCYLLDEDGRILAEASGLNPQAGFGADVISRLRAAQAGAAETMKNQVRSTMAALLESICSNPQELDTVSVVGNPAMQQLFLGLPVDNLLKIPFVPVLKKAGRSGKLLTVPDISGFVGADTVAGILACGLWEAEEMTLLVDIGTNGEMVLGNRHRMLACATAAGPALEGANIRFGMRAAPGAIDHVWLEAGKLTCSVMGGGEVRGICGSGLVDAIACALDLGLLNHRGKICNAEQKIHFTETTYLTQEDVRQVMLAKGAIAAGIRLLAQEMGIALADIRHVVLAGAFGSYLKPESACRIGLLPEELLGKITPAGNTAGQGAARLAAHPEQLDICRKIVESAEFLELAALPAFPKTFAKAMELPQDWCRSALALGFIHAVPLDPGLLRARQDVRAMCAQDKCHAYGKNWMCPPHCGSIEECQAQMHGYRRGILLQTVGQLSKEIDSLGYREAEASHLESFARFCRAIRRQYPEALCLGAGGCRVCRECAWPEPCRFPQQAVSSMEAYGLFVTQVCRDAGLSYHHGPKTITFTACVLF